MKHSVLLRSSLGTNYEHKMLATFTHLLQTVVLCVYVEKKETFFAEEGKIKIKRIFYYVLLKKKGLRGRDA